jgi:hypothetical protein
MINLLTFSHDCTPCTDKSESVSGEGRDKKLGFKTKRKRDEKKRAKKLKKKRQGKELDN